MPHLHDKGIRIYWESSGKGDPVVLLNGILMTTRSWSFQSVVLEQVYRCLMHDFRGQLLSSKPEIAWTLDQHVDDLEALLDRLGIETCHVIGTSYGGEVGMLFAARRPHRVRSLAVISSVSEVGEDVDKMVLEWRRAALEAPDSLYRTMLPTTFSERFVVANPGLIRAGEDRLRTCEPAFFEAFARLIDAFRLIDITPELQEIDCPTLVMVGDLDLLKPPRYSRLIAKRIKRAELVVVPDAGHALVLEQPEAVNAALLDLLRRSGST